MKERVQLYVKVAGTPSKEDEGIPGTYLVEVDADLPAEDRPTAALDVFHEHIGIDCLDDFTITVHDENDAVLPEKENAKSYSMGNRGDFLGKMDDLGEEVEEDASGPRFG